MKTKIIFLLAIGCLLLTTSCSKYKYETVKDDPMKTRIYTLKNGLKVYLSVNDEKPRIQTFIVVRTGSKNDPSETTGLAHYLEHLMFKGTNHFGVTDVEAEAPLLADIEARYEKYRKMTNPEERRQAYHEIDSVSQLAAKYFIPNEFDKLMSLIGAEGTNANTWHDRTCYVDDIPSNQIDTWLKIESDRFKNMVIRGFHTELEAVYEEYNIYLANDGEKMYDAYDYTGATGFLIGNEGNGLTDETADQADVYIRIPMGGKLESLNAAMAAGILMYEVNRQRRSK
jgi:predicted Zn-dependent peptidase